MSTEEVSMTGREPKPKPTLHDHEGNQEGEDPCEIVWKEVLEILRKQGRKLEEISDQQGELRERIDGIEDEMKQMGGNVQLIRRETQNHGHRLASSDQRCADRCKMLQEIVATNGASAAEAVDGKSEE